MGCLGWLVGAQGALFGDRFLDTYLGSHVVPKWEDVGLENVRCLYNGCQNQKINKELKSDAFGVDLGSILRLL